MREERPLAVAMPPLPHTEVGAAISRLCIWSGSACEEMGALFGSRCLSDNWKVPVLAWPSVPCA